MKRLFLSAFIATALLSPFSTQAKNVLDLKETITDQSIVYPETFEQDTRKLLESWYLRNYTTTDDRYARSGDVEVSDKVLKQRLAAMPTIIEMPFNQIVKDYIKRYTSKGRAQVAAILGLSLYYTPIFEQALEEAGLPLELKYLPVIESALNPNAVSKHGATGLWQLMLGTGKGLGLEVNSLVDERRDPYLSSEKAVSYLKDLYETYGDWSLAIAAYNCGPGTVNKALRRAGGDPKSHDFWSIYQYLSPETRGYVPMFIAANYVMTYHNEHNISPVLATKPLITDTVAVTNRLHFNQISEVLNMPVDELRILNPQFRADIIPGSPDHPYYLILPSQQIHAYIVSEEEILAHDADKYTPRTTAEPGDLPAVAYTPATEAESKTEQAEEAEVAEVRRSAAAATGKSAVTHKVVAGETISSIAGQYGCTAADIKEWNNLRRNAVRTGQQLKIYTASAQTNTPAPAKTATPAKAAAPAKAATPAKAAAPAKAATPAKAQESVATPKQKSKASAKTEQAAAPAATSKKSKKAAAAAQEPAQATGKKAKNAKKAKQPEKPKKVEMEVKSGDNLSKIAKKNGVTVEELRKANPNVKGDMLRPGDKLTIPSKQATPAKGKKGSKAAAEPAPAKKSKTSKKKKK